MFYVLSPVAGTVLALVLASVFASMFLKDFFKSRYGIRKKKVTLSVERSDSGKCHIENACYYPDMKKFYAKVKCQEIGYEWNLWADSRRELEYSIQKEFRRCDEKVRDRTNKQAMAKQRYFRIG